jgi:hypothetical protein
MKRATREWAMSLCTDAYASEGEYEVARDILYSDAKQRAEIRDLKARLKDREERLKEVRFQCRGREEPYARDLFRLVHVSLKNWRKP